MPSFGRSHATAPLPPDSDFPGPPSIQQQFLRSIAKGRRCIVAFCDEVDTPSFHYLITEFAGGGDLFNVLQKQSQRKVCEDVARVLFYQLCCAVRYLHAQSVAHLDLSLENVCLDDGGNIRLIDFGLAAQHPLYVGSHCTATSGGDGRHNDSHIRLLYSEDDATAGDCRCRSCCLTQQALLEQYNGGGGAPSATQALSSPASFAKLKFLCRPVCELVYKPGKLGYMAPELYAGRCWDAYKQDCFALGVILYTMLMGRPPFVLPDAQKDVWFRVIYSGQWLLPSVRSQGHAAIFCSLSPNASDLIDRIIKPQEIRPAIDDIMRHPFLFPLHSYRRDSSQ